MADDPHIPTLDDVARAAGVSTATVSRCLNTPDKVQEQTRRKVTDAIDALGYIPNFAARVMAAKRSFTIGAIIPTMENAIFARGLQAFQEELHDRGYTLLVASSAYRPDIEAEQIRKLVARGADGLLLIGQDRDPALYAYLDRHRISAVIAWTYAEDAPLPCIGFDNRASMRLLTEHVVGLGHRRIGVISGVLDGNDRAQLRLDGIRDVLGANGLELAPEALVEVPYEIESGSAAMDTLLSRDPGLTAILCGNDVLAVGALSRARARGIAVPDELSITGFDDIELARVALPALTTVHVPHREMGRQAAQRLVDIIERKASGQSVKLEATLMKRDSLGPRRVTA